MLMFVIIPLRSRFLRMVLKILWSIERFGKVKEINIDRPRHTNHVYYI